MRVRLTTPRLLVLALCWLAALAPAPPSAAGADRIYWGEGDPNRIRSADLDGTHVTALATGAADLLVPTGTAIDPAGDRIYWVNIFTGSISFAQLDGSGGGDVPISGASVSLPTGIAIEAGRRIYWASYGSDTLSSAALDGSDAHDIPIAGASLSPQGIAIDPIRRQLFWTNSNDTLSTARFDGSDAHDIAVTGARVEDPTGIAVDAEAGRMCWANSDVSVISCADLDGANGRDVAAGPLVNNPFGVAFDSTRGTVYWANNAGPASIVSARLDGSSGARVLVTGSVNLARFPVLLVAPRAVAAPAVDGGGFVGDRLDCSRGAWADSSTAFVYDVPQRIAYQWSRDGIDLPNATDATLMTDAAGSYVCRVQAENRAGTTVAASAPHLVRERETKDDGGGGSGDGGSGDGGSGDGGSAGDGGSVPIPPAFAADTGVTLAVAPVASGRRFAVRLVNRNRFPVSVALSARTARRVHGVPRRQPTTTPRFLLGGQQARDATLTLSGSMRRALARRATLRLVVTAILTDPSGRRRTVRRAVTVGRARR